jgi:mismatch-specific thymine-DNA glycosylase
MDYQTVIHVDGKEVKTLADILPNEKKMKILFIAKTPTPISVEKGHYFQGHQGKMFWNKLIDYNILSVKSGTFEDENLLDHQYGITDIAKVPRSFGNEPSKKEYQEGLERIEKLTDDYKAEILVFVYKGVLDNILKIAHGINKKSRYGMNNDLESLFGAKIFVFPMPGTSCTSEEADSSMIKLKKEIKPSR